MQDWKDQKLISWNQDNLGIKEQMTSYFFVIFARYFFSDFALLFLRGF